MKRLLALAMLAALAIVHACAYEIISRNLADSRIYPSTTHKYKISVPDGYNGSEACLYVGLDGILCDAPARIDSLIATGDIPPMIGVYLEPGYVADADGTVIRYNRSSEFDATDGRFARFIETELLPDVRSAVTAAGIPVRIKEGGEHAMIFGLSSGGIASFVASWLRPDLFSRIFSGCGTFVPMRGGNDLQALVRKAEPRPVRVFLQDGYSDTWNPLFGSWYEANVMLSTALQFAGYDCSFDWREGVHSVKTSAAIFPEVMKWMWSGYPEPPVAGTSGNATLARILENASGWECEKTDAPFEADTAAAVYPDGRHCVVPAPGSNYLTQYLLTEDGTRYAGQPFYWLHTLNNSACRLGGMAFDADGMLWVTTDSGIQICDQNGRVRAILSLPLELETALIDNPSDILAGSRLVIGKGYATIILPGRSYTRRLNVQPPEAGQRPRSQGQA